MYLEDHEWTSVESIVNRIPDSQDTRSRWLIDTGLKPQSDAFARLLRIAGQRDFISSMHAALKQIDDPSVLVAYLNTIQHDAVNNRDNIALSNLITTVTQRIEIRTAPVPLLKFDDETVRKSFLEQDLILNPYLISQGFVGRTKEIGELTGWLKADDQNDRLLCITDYGGAGKTSMIWHWLHLEDTLEWRVQNNCNLFWSTFYANDYDSTEFLKKLAIHLGVQGVDADGAPPGIDPFDERAYRAAWKVTIEAICQILNRDKDRRWLIVLDGLEREMGAYARPANQLYDSETQDCLKEKYESQSQVGAHVDYDIWSAVFVEFLKRVVKTSARLVVTSRLFPSDFSDRNGSISGFREFAFKPLKIQDVMELWASLGNTSDTSDRDALEFFFKSVSNHPQLVVIVGTAFHLSQDHSFGKWIERVGTPDEIDAIRNEESPTKSRHMWLSLATRDLRDEGLQWGLLCRIAFQPGETPVDSLIATTRRQTLVPETSRAKTIDRTETALRRLVDLRLIGFNEIRRMVDIHPVVRCHVYKYIVDLFRNPREREDFERHIRQELSELNAESGALLGLLDPRLYEEAFQKLEQQKIGMDAFIDLRQGYDGILNDYFARFYPRANGNADFTRLPIARSRKIQGFISSKTADLFSAMGRWAESMHSFELAETAYRLSNDVKSLHEIVRGKTWQQLYGGSLFEYESYFVRKYFDDKRNWNAQSDPFWLVLGLAVRRHPETAALLEKLGPGKTRWEVQTLAEAWYYLGKFQRACDMINHSIPELNLKTEFTQLLWERLTLGMAYLELGETDKAGPVLTGTHEKSMRISYAVTYTFALAGLIGWHAAKMVCMQDRQHPRFEELAAEGLKPHGRYVARDEKDQFQIPATLAHLGAARIYECLGDKEKALELTMRALKVASGKDLGFAFAAGVEGAQGLVKKLNAVVAVDTPLRENSRIKSHNDRLAIVLQELLADGSKEEFLS